MDLTVQIILRNKFNKNYFKEIKIKDYARLCYNRPTSLFYIYNLKTVTPPRP